jgi:O-antigen/teichoic acid export membrane protein
VRQSWPPVLRYRHRHANRGLLRHASRVQDTIAELIALMRFRAFDVHSADGRSNERYRRAGLTAASAFAAKAVALVCMIVTVPLVLHYLGAERYGLWLTISSVSIMLGFADFGIGNGVLNAVAEAYGQDNRTMAREAVSSGLLLLSLIGVGVVAVYALVGSIVPWAHLYNVTSHEAMDDAWPATTVFVLVWALNIPLDVVQRVQLGYQRGFVSNVWQAMGSLLALAGAFWAVRAGADLSWLVLALTGGPLLAVLLNGAVEFGWARPWLRPAWRSVRRAAARRLLHLGVLFFLIQLSTTFAWASDNIVVARVLGSAQVPQFAVPARLFAFIGVLVSVLIAPLWPAYGEALTRGDLTWVKRTLIRTVIFTLVLTIAPAVFLLAFGPALINAWVGDSVAPSFWLLAGLALWAPLSGLGSTVAVFLNGANILGFQAVCAAFMAASSLGLKVVFVREWGVAGVPWAMLIAYSLFVALPMLFYVPRLVRRLTVKASELARE